MCRWYLAWTWLADDRRSTSGLRCRKKREISGMSQAITLGKNFFRSLAFVHSAYKGSSYLICPALPATRRPLRSAPSPAQRSRNCSNSQAREDASANELKRSTRRSRRCQTQLKPVAGNALRDDLHIVSIALWRGDALWRFAILPAWEFSSAWMKRATGRIWGRWWWRRRRGRLRNAECGMRSSGFSGKPQARHPQLRSLRTC